MAICNPDFCINLVSATIIMSMKKLAMFSAMAMMLGGGNWGGGWNRFEFKTEEDRSPNYRKKCFRSGCENSRKGNKLYCSVECCKLHKSENK